MIDLRQGMSLKLPWMFAWNGQFPSAVKVHYLKQSWSRIYWASTINSDTTPFNQHPKAIDQYSIVSRNSRLYRPQYLTIIKSESSQVWAPNESCRKMPSSKGKPTDPKLREEVVEGMLSVKRP